MMTLAPDPMDDSLSVRYRGRRAAAPVVCGFTACVRALRRHGLGGASRRIVAVHATARTLTAAAAAGRNRRVDPPGVAAAAPLGGTAHSVGVAVAGREVGEVLPVAQLDPPVRRTAEVVGHLVVDVEVQVRHVAL